MSEVIRQQGQMSGDIDERWINERIAAIEVRITKLKKQENLLSIGQGPSDVVEKTKGEVKRLLGDFCDAILEYKRGPYRNKKLIDHAATRCLARTSHAQYDFLLDEKNTLADLMKRNREQIPASPAPEKPTSPPPAPKKSPAPRKAQAAPPRKGESKRAQRDRKPYKGDATKLTTGEFCHNLILRELKRIERNPLTKQSWDALSRLRSGMEREELERSIKPLIEDCEKFAAIKASVPHIVVNILARRGVIDEATLRELFGLYEDD